MMTPAEKERLAVLEMDASAFRTQVNFLYLKITSIQSRIEEIKKDDIKPLEPECMTDVQLILEFNRRFKGDLRELMRKLRGLGL